MRVLVVEDDADTRDIIVELLEGSGFEVLAATEGRAGLEAMSEVVPDVVLLDAVMPEMDGWEFIEELGRRPDVAGVPVLLMTGISKPPLSTGGVAGVLQKPFSAGQLVQALLSAHQRGRGAGAVGGEPLSSHTAGPR